MRAIISDNPITLNGTKMKEKKSEKYLGDFFSQEGLAKSIETTINERYWRVLTSIKEVRAILEDCRIHRVGGALAGWKIWESAILPTLINNSETWEMIPKEVLNKLENLQLMMIRNLFGAYKTTPKPALLWDLGAMSVEMKIKQRMLNFIFHLTSLDETTLAKQVFTTQHKMSFPGLVKHAQKTMQELDLPDICFAKNRTMTGKTWNQLVKSKISAKMEADLLHEVKSKPYTKLINGPMSNERFETKEYLREMTLSSARTNFKLRSKTIEVKYNFKNNPKYKAERWRCDSCVSELAIEDQQHIIVCPAYEKLRVDRSLDNDQDLVNYFKEVLSIRDKLGINK